MQNIQNQIFLKDFSKYIKDYSENQQLLDSYDLTILDELNQKNQELEDTLKKNKEWFYKEIIRDQHIGIELINRYFKQRKRLGFEETLISQTLQNLQIAQSLLKDNDPGYPDILGKNFFISNLYGSFVQELNNFFSPRFQINSDDFANSIKSLEKFKFKDHQTIMHILNKIKYNFGLDYNDEFNLTITRDLLQISIIKDQLMDQKSFKQYLAQILSIKQPKLKQISKKENSEQKKIVKSDLKEKNENQNQQQSLNQYSVQNDNDFFEEEVNIPVEEYLEQNQLNKAQEDNINNLPDDNNNDELKTTEQVMEELDNIFKNTNDFLNNVKVLQYKYFSSIKTLRENYFELTSEQKKKFIEQDPYLLLSLKQFEYMLMKIGIISPRDLLIDESDQQTDKQFDQIISDQILNLNLNPSLLNLTFQDHQQQVEYDLETLIDGGKQYQLDQNIQSLLNFVQLLKNIENINEYSYEVLKDKYQDNKDVYEENDQRFKYYYTNTFNQCRQDIKDIVNDLQQKDLNMIQKLKIHIINQVIIEQNDNKQDLLNSINENVQLSDQDIQVIIQYAYQIDYDILQKIILNFNEQIQIQMDQHLNQLDQNKISNIGCILSIMIKNKSIQEQDINKVLRKLFSFSQLEYLSSNEAYNTQFQIQQIIFMLQYHEKLDQDYYENDQINLLFQQALSRLNNLNKKFKYHKDPILQSINQSYYNFYEEQGFLNKLQNDNFVQYPIILNNSNNKIVFLDFVSENYTNDSSILISRNFFIESILSKDNNQIECIQKTLKLSDLTQDQNYYQNFNFELKENLNEIVKKTFDKEQEDEDNMIKELKLLNDQLDQKQEDNHTFILSQMLNKIIIDLKKHQNNNDIQNRINIQLTFLLNLIEQRSSINTLELRQILQQKQQQKKINYKFNFVGKRQIQNHNLDTQFDNYETTILNYQIFANAEYFLFQDWEIQLKDKLGSNQFYESDKFLFQNYGFLRKLIIPSILGRQQRKISNVNIFWEYYINQDINLDLKQKLYTLEQFVDNDQQLTQSELWKLSLLNFSYEFRSQQNIVQKLKQFFQMKFFTKLFETQSQNNESQSIYSSQFLNQILQEKIQSKSPYEKQLAPYIIFKKEIDYYQNLVQNILPEKIIDEQDQQKQNTLKKELQDAKLQYHKLMDRFKKEFTLNYNQLEEKLLMKDYINVLNYNQDDSPTQENQEIYNQQQLELIIVNNLLKNLLIYKNENQISLTQQEENIFNEYKNQIEENYLKHQILLIKEIPNLQIKELFEEEDYIIFENLFPYTEIRKFGDQNIKDLLIMMSIHFNTEQINQFESTTFIQKFISENNTDLDNQQFKDIMLLFNDQPQTQQNFNSLYHENKTYQNAQQIDDFEKQIYLEMFQLDRGGSEIDKKWLEQDKKELSQFIDEANQKSNDPRKDMQNCNLKRFSKKKI